MFTCTIDEITKDATVMKDGSLIGEASFANKTQREAFLDLITVGARPTRAAMVSGAIYIATRKSRQE